VYTFAVLVGIVLTIGGAVIAVLGLGKPTAVSFEAQGVMLKTTSVGLVIMVAGALLTAVLLVTKPPDVGVGDRSGLPLDRAIAFGVAAIGAIGAVLLAVSLATQ
jgi:hypothetical protein